jgi:hypothetical protein
MLIASRVIRSDLQQEHPFSSIIAVSFIGSPDSHSLKNVVRHVLPLTSLRLIHRSQLLTLQSDFMRGFWKWMSMCPFHQRLPILSSCMGTIFTLITRSSMKYVSASDLRHSLVEKLLTLLVFSVLICCSSCRKGEEHFSLFPLMPQHFVSFYRQTVLISNPSPVKSYALEVGDRHHLVAHNVARHQPLLFEYMEERKHAYIETFDQHIVIRVRSRRMEVDAVVCVNRSHNLRLRRWNNKSKQSRECQWSKSKVMRSVPRLRSRIGRRKKRRRRRKRRDLSMSAFRFESKYGSFLSVDSKGRVSLTKDLSRNSEFRLRESCHGRQTSTTIHQRERDC